MGLEHTFLVSPIDGGEWSDSSFCRFTSGEITPVIFLIGGWVSPRAGLNTVTKRKNPSLHLLGI
jgi:hypothetical protein